jgi:hypothetical protein
MYVNLEVSNMDEMGCTDDLKFDGSTDVTAQQHRQLGAMMGRAVFERLHCRPCGLEAEYLLYFLLGMAWQRTDEQWRLATSDPESHTKSEAGTGIRCYRILSEFAFGLRMPWTLLGGPQPFRTSPPLLSTKPLPRCSLVLAR